MRSRSFVAVALVLFMGSAAANGVDSQLELRRAALKNNGQASAQLGDRQPIEVTATRVAMVDGTVCGWVRLSVGPEQRLYLTCPAGSTPDRLHK